MREERKKRTVGRAQRGRVKDPWTKQATSQLASQLVRGRREGDADDESLVRSKWEQKRKRKKQKQ